MGIIAAILAVAGAYLMGSIPSAVWVSKALYNRDVREHGSGNAGLTNMYRVFGWKAAVPVAVMDLGKGLLVAWLAFGVPQGFLASRDFSLLAGAICILGHSFTCFAGFRGGKGVLTALGVYLFLTPVSAVGAFAVWVAVVRTSGFVSLASIAGAVALAVMMVFEWVLSRATGAMLLLTLALSLFVIIRHRSNIGRLVAGTEHRFGARPDADSPGGEKR